MHCHLSWILSTPIPLHTYMCSPRSNERDDLRRCHCSTPKVSVHTIHPGATQTSFFEKVGVPAGAFDTSSFADPVCPLFCFVRILELQYFVLLW